MPQPAASTRHHSPFPWLTLAWIALATTSLAALADDPTPPPPAWQGVWQGSIGKHPVRLCLAHEGGSAYYYLRHLAPIPLHSIDTASQTPAAAPPQWREGNDSEDTAPTLTLTPQSADQLTGNWADKTQHLPITLTRLKMAATEENGPCGSDAFNEPLEKNARFSTSEQTRNGYKLRFYHADSGPNKDADPALALSTFEILASGDAIRRINHDLTDDFPRAKRELPKLFDCNRSNLASFGESGEESRTISPVVITPDLLIVESAESGNCGGAHPFGDTDYPIWDMHTGQHFDFWQWFKHTPAKAAQGDQTATRPQPTILPRLAQNWQDNEDCQDPIEHADWTIHPGKDGLAFMPSLPHVVQACADDVTILWAELPRYLTPSGKKAIESLRQAFAATNAK